LTRFSRKKIVWGFYVMKHDPNKAMIINPRKIYRCGIENSGK